MANPATLKSILIVDGDEQVAAMFAEVFTRADWTVTMYSDGQHAAAALRGRAHYDAVLLSSRLAGIRGVDLITLIRALDHRRDVAIVMLTGAIDVGVCADALAAGADDVLYKPVDTTSVLDTVNKCVERRRR
jgi:two-component system, cell cycle response regulator